ncbi:MAG: FAD-dependent thymidylate synthase [Patescibacteria group bacterium]|nr:FAD-dependent thymidylate synthase [Patescibacteria group bacterium]
MNYPRRIYPLENLPPEVKAVTFAKCSRLPLPFDQIAQELTEEKSSQFHEKWVLGFGHSSIAEHAVLSLAIENVSILATKAIEDTRLASFTEKSTRYQVFERDKFYRPKRILNSEFKNLYEKTCQKLIDCYLNLYEKIREKIKMELSSFSEMELKTKTCDIVRFILPTATLTNLGMTINARSLAHLIKKLLSSPLEEFQEIGQELKSAGLKIVPTLLKYTEVNSYLIQTSKNLARLTKKILKQKPQRSHYQSVELVEYDKNAEEKIITALLYRFSNLSYQEIKKKVKKMSRGEKEKIFSEAMRKRGFHDQPLRELEHTYYTFDLLLDYGAFRDLQRHRICTQTNQKLTTDYGYSLPIEIEKYGFKQEYEKTMKEAGEAFKKISKKFPEEASYLLPLAFRKRFLLTLNLRELYHLIPLRSSSKAHSSYRQIAQQMYQEVKRVHPQLIKFIKISN